MNPLIYLTITGTDEHFKTLGRNCVKSLRQFGKFTHDVIVLSDSDFEIENAKVINCLDKKRHPVIQRCFVLDYIDVSKYTHICYLDADILIMNDIYPLFRDNENIQYAEEGITIENAFSDKNNVFFMSMEEKQKWKNKHTINAGQFVVCGDIAAAFFRLWIKTIGSNNEFGIDQAGLNYIIRKEFFPSKPMRKVLFSAGVNEIKNGCIINHFNCNHRSGFYNSVSTALFSEYPIVGKGKEIELRLIEEPPKITVTKPVTVNRTNSTFFKKQ